MPAGGARSRGYKRLAEAEAGTVSRLFSDSISEILSRLQQMSQFGTGATLNANQGVAASADALGQLSAARANAYAGGLGGIAQAFGTYFGMR